VVCRGPGGEFDARAAINQCGSRPGDRRMAETLPSMARRERSF
jgi:hypothetical protein